ncbi:hypothetical protein B0A48_01160 [Cryoendolithus antarcticus]|uniref:Chromatin modification-related protein n=1 Tax=Cryoendolithus antarcticus TaxID=1507870 RepID=A0A1V8TSI6_9PEZI|nr:hypothetical protein B0A48_01160 [Cryoendolithus antarcticus]
MALNMPEDAASVLEQFVHDVANTPAEVTHLLEEIQSKDAQILAYKDEIAKRDAALQKWVRINGGHVQNPKEEAFSKTINDCFDKCEILQAEKLGLSEKALIVLERQLKRLDVGLRHLAVREEFPADWNGPSMLSGTTTGVSTPVVHAGSHGGPLQGISGNVGVSGGAPNIANAAQLRMAHAAAATRAAAATTPATAPRAQRETSSEASKRRRPHVSLGALPTAASSLRQSSLGPGTPKASTPVPAPTSSRAGSAQPPQKAGAPKRAPTSNASARRPPPTQPTRKRIRTSNLSGPPKKGDRRRTLARRSGTPSSHSPSLSPTPSDLAASNLARQADGAAGSEEEDAEEGDDALYCFCQKVSFGDMVACDNDACKYMWFHWSCVGLAETPTGEWFCPDCRKGK